MKKEQIKKLFNKISLFTLCAFSLPFVVHGSSLETPKSSHTHRYTRGDTGHAEVDVLMEKCVKQPSISLMSFSYDRIGLSLEGPALEISDRIDSIINTPELNKKF